MKSTLIGVMGLSFFGLASAYATPQPLPNTFLGGTYSLQVGWWQ